MPVWVGMVVLVLFIALINIVESPERENAAEQPFKVTVSSQKLLCLNSGACLQEVVVEDARKRYRLKLNKEPWLEEGAEVEIIRVHRDATIIPGGSRYGSGPAEIGGGYYYKVHRDAGSPPPGPPT